MANKVTFPENFLWGAATAQIFGSVSPAMHKEFGLDYWSNRINRHIRTNRTDRNNRSLRSHR